METIGKYKIIRELGSGGFGAVYLAEDPHLGDKVAIKVFQIKDPALAREVTSATGDAGEILKQRFLDEAKILRRLSASPHVVSVHEFETLPDGCPYYVMPYLPNSLVDLIGRDAFTAGKLEEIDSKDHPRSLPVTQALDILKQTLEGLKTVHEAGLVHRDIKPANLLIETKGQLHNVVLCDFGIAKMPEGEHSKTGVGMGSPNYVSPEQRESAKHVDARSDVFSVGVLAYRMLTGSVPMVTGLQSIKQFIPAINDELNDLVMNAIDFNTAKRPANAGEFLKQLKQAEAAFTGNLDDVEESGTWVNNGEGSIRDELKPLRDEIHKLLSEHGQVPEGELPALQISASMADLDEQGLNDLIEEVLQANQKELKPKRKLRELIQQRSKTSDNLSAAEYQAFLRQVKNIGWDEAKLNRLLSEAGLQLQATETPEKAQASKPVTEKKSGKSSLTMVLGLLLVLTLGSGGYWYMGYQQEQAELAHQADVAKQSEAKAWQQAKNLNTVSAYELYQSTWPKGAYNAQAQQAKTELQEQARMAQLSVEQQQTEYTQQAQQKLIKLGYRLTENGKLDTRTQKAIIAFEKQAQLLETGEVDATLIAALNKAIEKQNAKLAKQQAKKANDEKAARNKAEMERIAKEKAKEQAAKKLKAQQAYIALVKATQTELNRIGYAVGRPDGAIGKQTQTALQHYQKGNKLKQSGKVNESLLAHLKRASKKPGRSAGETFKDCSDCPEMMVIPAGSFQMGSNDGDSDEKPVHRVSIPEVFAIGKYEVTWNNYQPCIDAGVCSSDGDAGFGKGNRPVIKVSWEDAQTYATWLSKKTGKQYRLPNEAEWEYAARAGSTTKYSWGDSINCSQARYGYYSDDCGKQESTDPVGLFKANSFGLYDMHGNVLEWTQDCWNDSYNDAPSTNKAWELGDCAKRVLRGGSWDGGPNNLRSADRVRYTASGRDVVVGFRLVQGR